MKKSIKILLVAIIISLSIITRLSLLNIRPLHHDEGVNYFFAKQILTQGIFQYNPTNYHGPTYFFAIAISFAVLGISEFSLRFPAAIFGILIALIPFFFKKPQNKYLASILLLLSPSLMYYSRYSIHESLFVLSTLIALYAFSTIMQTKSLKHLLLFSTALAIAFTTKETISITLLILTAITLFNYKQIKKLKIKNQKNTILLSIAIFLVIYIIFFTSFFTNPQGILNSIKGYFPWLNRGFAEQGHAKPFYYYIQLLLKYELPLLLLALLAIPKAFKTKNIFIKNLSLWFLANLVIYSLISYKTPWLIISITAPMALLSAFSISLLKNKKLKYFIITITIIYLSIISINLNFINTWQNNSLAYVHTNPDILNLVNEINANYKENSKIIILSDEYWPLPFYLNGKDVMYFDKTETFNQTLMKEYDIFIAKEKIAKEMENIQNLTHSKHILRENLILHLFIDN